MSLFGKKNNDDLSAGDDGDDIQMNFDGGDAGGPDDGGKRKKMIAIGGIVAVLAAGGAYMALSGGDDMPVPPPRANPLNPPGMNPEIAQERPIDAPPMPAADGGAAPAGEVASANPVTPPGGEMPVANPAGGAAPADGTAPAAITAPAIDPVTGLPAPAAATDPATAALGVPPADAGVPAIDPKAPLTPGINTDLAQGATPAGANTVTTAGGNTVTPADANPVTAADANITAADAAATDVNPAAKAAEATAKTEPAANADAAAANAVAKAAADAAPVVPATGEDLPAPVLPPSAVKASPDKKDVATSETPVPAAAAATAATAATASSNTGALSGTVENAKPKKAAAQSSAAGEPSKGEMAIVQNGAMLDELTATPDGEPHVLTDMERAILDANIQDALIRPTPKSYIVVKKTSEAGDIDSRLTSARSALARGSNTAALQLFNEIYKSYPKDSRVLMGRAVALQRLGQSDQALAAYEEVLTNNPKNLEALTNMLGLIKQQNPSLAVEKLLALREAYPDNADITAQLGVAYASSGAYEDAGRYLDMAEALSPGSPTVLYNKAVLFDKMGRSREAGELYRQIIRMNSDGSLDAVLPIESIRNRLSTLR